MKKTKGVSLDEVLGRELKDKEIKLAFDQSRFYLDVARLISNLREKKGVSQAQLAKTAVVSQPLIARLEKGDQRRMPTFDLIFRVLKALGYRLEIRAQPDAKKKPPKPDWF